MSEFRSRPATRHAAIVVLAPKDAPRLAAQALDLGANDVTDLDLRERELRLRLDRQLELKREADALRRTIDDGLRAATTDKLTGLFDRRYAEYHLARIHAEAAETGRSYAVVLADIDLFKQVNDRYGHPAGDLVLTAFGGRLRDTLRGPDLFARLGGEEFLALLPDTDRHGAGIVAERLATITRETPVRLPTGEAVSITASFGVASVPPYAPLDDVLARADAALYAAKTAGRDRVAFAPDPEPPRRATS